METETRCCLKRKTLGKNTEGGREGIAHSLAQWGEKVKTELGKTGKRKRDEIALQKVYEKAQRKKERYWWK